MFHNIYHNKKVLITGHTGFKGSWLALWLLDLGAELFGYSLEPPTKPNHFSLLTVNMESIIGDVRDADYLKKVFKRHKPEIVFHLAAQPIVRASYKEPVDTFTTNVLGTINVLEATRDCSTVAAFVNITSDKCYENKESGRGYNENDPLGGYDPYSASKGCSEIITACWRSSFFNTKKYGSTHNVLLATGRAGNVIGGGDWAVDRLMPDVMRATEKNERVIIRNPNAVRAWQHVLEPLSGYLLLGQGLLENKKEFAEAWNFGPNEEENISVGKIIDQTQKIWSKVMYEIHSDPDQPHEADTLTLNCSKARSELKWRSVWDVKDAVEKTVLWYKSFYESGELRSSQDLKEYIAEAKTKNIRWSIE